MSTSNGLNNTSTDLIATGFLIAIICEFLFLPHVPKADFLFFILTLVGCFLLFFNKEYPIQNGRFALAIALCLIGAAIPLFINSAWFSRIIPVN